jgi:hypothetical protein
VDSVKRFRWLRVLIVGALTLAIVIALSLPRQAGDEDFIARVERPAYAPDLPTRPVVLIDRAHFNFHTLDKRYKPFAELMRADGYDVRPNTKRFSRPALAEADVLVVVNGLGLRGSLQMLLTALRLDGLVDLSGSAFSDRESEALADWVRGGGALLLIADHAPCGKAAARLASRFGVGMTNGWAEDDRPNHDPSTDHWGFLLFSRENGLLGDHAITAGRDPAERVDRVVSFAGQALAPPPGSTVFLRLSPTARIYRKARSANDDYVPAAGMGQGVALLYGQGRVVVLGEAAMLTSQEARCRGETFHFGLDWPGTDNRKLALNIMHWLSRLLDGGAP